MAVTLESKLDLVKEHHEEYQAKPEPRLIEIAPATYLTFEGQGSPEGQGFQQAFPAIYGLAYTIKMASKRAGRDFKMGMLEALWWTPSGSFDYENMKPEDWRWKLIVRVPDFVRQADVDQALAELQKRGRGAGSEAVRLETIEEGLSVQAMHVGPYADERRTLGAMMEFMRAHGLRFRGPHHEIYFSDPRRVPPERLKTILRQPVTREP